MEILKKNELDEQRVIDSVVNCLLRGGLVIYPTETVYGVGVDATNPEAVQKLLKYKSRREGKPLSIAVTDLEMAEKYVEINAQAQQIYSKFLPGPFTVVSKNLGKVAVGVASEFNTLGVRIPDYDLILKIVAKLGRPITATSANSSGKKSPYTIEDVLQNLSNKQKGLIDLIIDAGKLPPNQPSTVIDTTLSTPVTMRQGDYFLAQQQTDFVSIKNLPNKTELTDFATKTLTFPSASEDDTEGIAGRLLLKHWSQLSKTGLVIGLNGPLGAGKTIFAKGAAKFLQINEAITSPTYSYVNEYDFLRSASATQGKFFHLDVWKIDSFEQFKLLEFEKMLGPNNLVLVEWWDLVKNFVADLGLKLNLLEVELQTKDPAQNLFDAAQVFQANLENSDNNRVLVIKEKLLKDLLN